MTGATVELTLLGGVLQFTLDEIDAPIAFFTVRFGGFTLTARGDDMAYTLPADKQVSVRVSYVDANGNPATVDGAVTWESSNTDIARVESTGSDSFEAVVAPGAAIGQVQITARADADLGAGMRELVTLMDVTVVGGEAVAGTIAPVGEPTDKVQVEPHKR